MNDYTWVITRDDSDDPHIDVSLVGTRGRGFEDLTNEQVTTHPQAIEFRMRDEDNRILFHGFYLGNERDEEAMAEPLELFGRNHDCVLIAYRDLMGRWDVIA